MSSASMERLAAALAGRYRLERELGAGGMATVYLAHDVRHDRKVAVKMVRPELAATIGVERFLSEIRVTANLQHPNILGLFDSGIVDGQAYYVMPFVEGESLRDRLKRERQLPVQDAVRIGREVADALDYAHQRGIVHRDIKPENILLSAGHAMVVDFGIARAIGEAGGDRLTATGIAVGTVLYMSPEQASGERVVDGRSDVYSLGCVLYETLAGEPPYTGPTAQAILARRLTQTVPPLRVVRDAVPAALEHAIVRALAPVPADRFPTCAEFRAALEPLAATNGKPSLSRAVRRFSTPAIIAMLALAALLGALGLRLFLIRPLSLTTANAIAVTSAPGVEYQPALSPDGNEVAFVAQRDGRYVLSVRSTIAGSGEGELRPAETTPGTQRFPSWSPDGEFIRFYSCVPDGCLWREVARLGGSARIVELPRQSPWTAWSRDAARAAFVINDSIFVYTVADRSTRLLAVLPGPADQHSLAWSPDGRLLAYVDANSNWPDSPNTQNAAIWIVAAATGKRVAVTTAEHINVSPAWYDERHLLFVSNRDGQREVYVVQVGPEGPRGVPLKVAGGSDAYSVSVSADGTRLALAKFEIRQNVREYRIGASGPVSIRNGRPVTSGTQVVEGHDVSPDGQWLVYDSNRRGHADIYKVRVEGGEPIPLVTGPTDAFGPVWSPDEREVVYWAGYPADVFVVSAEGGTPMRVTHSPADDFLAHWSPDGLNLAFLSRRSGRLAAWRLARERVGAPWHEPVQLTDFGCYSTYWAPDGSGVLCTVDNGFALVSGAGTILWRRDLSAAGFSEVSGFSGFAEGGSSLYLTATRGERQGIWSWPLAGGEPRFLVAFDDPLLTPGIVSARGDRLYLTVAPHESDIWVMNLNY